MFQKSWDRKKEGLLSTDVLLHFPPTNHSIESRTLQSVFPPSAVKIGPIFLTESWLQKKLGRFLHK